MQVCEKCQPQHKIKKNDKMLLSEYYTVLPTRNY